MAGVASGVSRIWGCKRPGKCSKTARARTRGSGSLSAVLGKMLARPAIRNTACRGWWRLVAVGCASSTVMMEDSRVAGAGLTNVKQYNLRRPPSLDIKIRGTHVARSLLSRGR
jgi:hypothetical protein